MKCLLHKPEDLESGPHHTSQKPGSVPCASLPNPGEAETDGWVPIAQGPGGFAESASSWL